MIKSATDNFCETKSLPSNNKAVLNDLNGFFISHFFKLMYGTVDVVHSEDSAFGQSSGEKIFREFLLNEYGNIMGKKFHLTNEIISPYLNAQRTQPLPVRGETTVDVRS